MQFRPYLAYIRTKHSALVRCMVVGTSSSHVDVVLLPMGEYTLQQGRYQAYTYPISHLVPFNEGFALTMHARAEAMYTKYGIEQTDHPHFSSLLAFHVYSKAKHTLPEDGYLVSESEPGVLNCTCPQFNKVPTLCKHTEFVRIMLAWLGQFTNKDLLDAALRVSGNDIRFKPGRGGCYVEVWNALSDNDTIQRRRLAFEEELDHKARSARRQWYAANVNLDF